MRLFDPTGAPAVPPPGGRSDVAAWRRRKRRAIHVGELVEKYLIWTERRGLHSPQRRKAVVKTLREFVLEAGALDLDRLRQMHLDDFVDRHPQWKAPNTRRGAAAMVHAVFEWGREQGRSRRNPFSLGGYPEGERGPQTTDDLFELLCRHAIKPAERIVRWIRYTGCRVGEAARCEWDQLDLARRVWTIHVHKTRKHTKRDKLVQLTDMAVALLDGLPRCEGPVFPNSRGRRYSPQSLANYVQRLRDRLGVTETLNLKGMRHRLATAALVNNAPLPLVSAQLGHGSIQTTMKHYAHVADHPEAVRAAAELGMPRC